MSNEKYVTGIIILKNEETILRQELTFPLF